MYRSRFLLAMAASVSDPLWVICSQLRFLCRCFSTPLLVMSAVIADNAMIALLRDCLIACLMLDA